MGAIAIKMPLPPGFMTTLYNNDARYEEAYLSEFPGYYSAGDAGFRDENGCASHPAQSLVMMMLLLALIKSAASDLDLLVSATNPI
jgi:hypothetical protein